MGGRYASALDVVTGIGAGTRRHTHRRASQSLTGATVARPNFGVSGVQGLLSATLKQRAEVSRAEADMTMHGVQAPFGSWPPACYQKE